MSAGRVDLNADLGESYGRWTLGDDPALLRCITSANVACGFHAGDPATLVATCRACVERDLAIGAQVGYPDLRGFGRRFLDIEPEDLYADVLYQIGALDGIARSAGGRVAYVKPHGALYNVVVHNPDQAGAVVRAVADYPSELAVLGLPGSALLVLAQQRGLRSVAEAFADRAYASDGTLVSRRLPGSVLHDVDVVVARVVRLVTQRQIVSVEGTPIAVRADSVCVHGDTPGAASMASAVRAALTEAGVSVVPFTAGAF